MPKIRRRRFTRRRRSIRAIHRLKRRRTIRRTRLRRKPLRMRRSRLSVRRRINSKISKWVASQPLSRTNHIDSALGLWNLESQLFDFDTIVMGNISDYNFVQSAVGTQNMIITRMRHRFTITNQSLHPAMVTFYPWVCRTDIPDLNSTTPITTMIANGFGLATGGSTGNPGSVGTTPFMSSSFGHFLKARKPWKKMIMPGKSYVVTLRNRNLLKWENTRWMGISYPGSGTQAALRGITKGVGIVAQSPPVNDSVATSTQIQSASGKLIIVSDKHWSYVNAPNPHKWQLTDSTIALTGAEHYLNSLTGAVVTGPVTA